LSPGPSRTLGCSLVGLRGGYTEIASWSRSGFTCNPTGADCGSDAAGVTTGKHNHRRETAHGGGDHMRETALVISARSLSAPIIAELARLLGRSSLPLDDVALDKDAGMIEDDEFIGAVWQEVGDDLRDAMRRYPRA